MYLSWFLDVTSMEWSGDMGYGYGCGYRYGKVFILDLGVVFKGFLDPSIEPSSDGPAGLSIVSLGATC